MARLPRISIAGHPHLMLIEATPEGVLFVDDGDRADFVAALVDCGRECHVDIHAYVLLDREALLLLTPLEADGVARFMQRLGRRHAGAFNLRHGRRGPVWGRRYSSAPIDVNEVGWSVIRLIEQAPVRDGRVLRAQDWAWSSASHHVGGDRKVAIRVHALHWQLGNTPFERELRHREKLEVLLPEREVERLMSAVRRGRPVGGSSFISHLETETGRSLQVRSRGRPPKLESGA